MMLARSRIPPAQFSKAVHGYDQQLTEAIFFTTAEAPVHSGSCAVLTPISGAWRVTGAGATSADVPDYIISS